MSLPVFRTFFLVYPRNRHCHFMQIDHEENICINVKVYFLEKIRKTNISKCRLLIFLPRMLRLNAIIAKSQRHLYLRHDQNEKKCGMENLNVLDLCEVSSLLLVPCYLFPVPCYIFLVTCFLLLISWSLLLIFVPCYLFLVPCYLFRVTHSLLLVPFYLFRVTYSLLLVPFYLFLVTYSLFLILYSLLLIPCSFLHIPCPLLLISCSPLLILCYLFLVPCETKSAPEW